LRESEIETDDALEVILNTTIANSISCKLDGHDVHVLIDTGASASLISKAVYDQYPSLRAQKLEKLPRRIAKSASGSSIELLGAVWLTLELPNKVGIIRQRVLVADPLITDVILGMDFLNASRAKLDFEENTLTFPEFEPVPLVDRRNPVGDVRIVAKESVVLPPFSQTVVLATAPALKHVEGYEGLIEPCEMMSAKYNVVGGRVLAKVYDGEIPCVLMNPNDKPIRIYGCSTLGYLTRCNVDVISNFVDSETSTVTSENCHLNMTNNCEINAIDRTRLTDPPNVNLSDSDLNEDQKNRLKKLLQQYRDVFANTDEELGRSGIIKMHIDTGDSLPLKQRPYRVSPIQKNIIDTHVQRMVDQKVVVPSDSPWSSPVILVKKF
jgi:predicted aspartyl protease